MNKTPSKQWFYWEEYTTGSLSPLGEKNDARILMLFKIIIIFSFRFVSLFSDFFGLLLQTDLVNTIGESAALGAAGVVLWGSMQYASSKVGLIGLLALRNHFNTFSLPPYPS